MGFLDGVRVIDSTRLLPGGFCTMLLSDMGAEVVKVEQPGLGDYMRATPPVKKGKSPVHATVNRNKKSIGIDLKAPEGKDIMRRLLKEADIFVEGFRPGAMARLGFSFDDVKRFNPEIIYCSISSYGQRSRLSSMPAHDINFQAMAGTLGYSPKPAVPLLQLGDIAAGMYAALGILGAMVHHEGAVYLDVPIVGSLLSWMVIPASAYLATGRPPREGHSLVLGSTPYYNVYETSDRRSVAVAAIEGEFWRNLMTALGLPQLEDERLRTKEDRKASSKLERVFATRTRDEWAKRLMQKDTCVTPVLTIEEALTSGWAKGLSVLVNLPGGERVLNGPLRSRPPMRGRAFTRAPRLGEDTRSIMTSLGYSRRRVRELMAHHVVE